MFTFWAHELRRESFCLDRKPAWVFTPSLELQQELMLSFPHHLYNLTYHHRYIDINKDGRETGQADGNHLLSLLKTESSGSATGLCLLHPSPLRLQGKCNPLHCHRASTQLIEMGMGVCG